MHATMRRHTVVAAVSALSHGLPAGGCGNSGTGPAPVHAADSQGVLLHPYPGTQPGPDGG
ncbi:hypothetical protein [Streptomyces candidus]|uniref:Uncharacterized protein n=1 Tax=Streptomyces candidus TaxID=67283 RepID=A0A7X0HJB6_9ACTN|nr:hypothetical protein [Streptomyces candidus]MBB6438715.1 hypothetical protein [Streptomyces candidus]GHH53262.1 hypothetical protein GCM10018773_54580 [Streptomyces candidus]